MSTYISHFGIKGQKWGIRRYQNKDGSLTAEGKKKYNQENPPKRSKKEQKQLKKIQENYQGLVKKEWLNSYNDAARYTNEVLIPEIDKKYGGSDFFSKVKFDKYGDVDLRRTPPDLAKKYQQYDDEIMAAMSDTLDMKMSELYDRIGYYPE